MMGTGEVSIAVSWQIIKKMAAGCFGETGDGANHMGRMYIMAGMDDCNKKFVYHDRESKQKAVAIRFNQYFAGKVLDVGADEGYLSQHLSSETEYTGVGLGGGNPKILKMDLEKESFVFENNSFDCVICLDVLEHLDNLYEVLGQLFAVSRNYIIISLPNPWKAFLLSLRKKYNETQIIKFYGLPDHEPEDRHKWFFSPSEAHSLIVSAAKENHCSLAEYYHEDSIANERSFSKKMAKKIIQWLLRCCFRSDLSVDDLFGGTSWWVLKKSR